MIRVIGGTAKGRRLLGPPVRRTPTPKPSRAGLRSKNAAPPPTRTVLHAETRPTSDLIRGVIFDMLDAMGAEYDRVLDLYAGTGALGIEALSRGDGTADFVERDATTTRLIRENLGACGFEKRGVVHHLTTERAVVRLAHDLSEYDFSPYTLILADPPYYDEGAPAAVRSIADSALVGPETVLVYEHHRRLEPPDALGPLPLYRTRRAGDTVVSIYGRPDDMDDEEEDEDNP